MENSAKMGSICVYITTQYYSVKPVGTTQLTFTFSKSIIEIPEKL